jgi:molybdopterin-guanine dinucleotide biosynthesis protein MobB
MRVFGIGGFRNSGKTTLLVGLVRHFNAAGLRVSTVKHAHHGFDLDRPGKDSYRHRAAGAREVLLSAAGRWALMRELPEPEEPPLRLLLAQLEAVDLVLVEGFKRDPHPKLQVVRAVRDARPLADDAGHVLAFAASEPDLVPAALAGRRPVFALDDIAAIAPFVLEQARPFE